MTHRVLLAGLFHETHTFLDGLTGVDDFQIRRGEELLAAAGDGSPLAGALQVAEERRWQLLPAIDLRATPGATVADAVLETFWDGFQKAGSAELARGVDGIYLVLHGAMACESFRDVEGEVIARIRRLPGAASVPICGVMDLHGNISRATIESTQGLVAYRCCPHTDSHQSAVRAARWLDRLMTGGERPAGVWEHPPVIWPPTGTGTDDDPMRSLEAMARQIENDHPQIAVVNVFAGFSFADTPDTGVSFSAFTLGDRETAAAELRRMGEWAFEHRATGNVVDPPLEDVMPAICEKAVRGEGPIAIVEPADNVGGGAAGDATTVLRLLIERGVDGAAVVINDPQSVQILRGKQVGDSLSLSIGGKGNRMTEGPLVLDVELLSVSDGRFELEDRNSHLASMSGVHIDMGPSAVVRHHGVRMLLTTHKTPPFDLGQLRSQGIEPESLSVVGVKAAVAHRRAYDRILKSSYTVATPGPCTSDIRAFAFEHVRRPVYPLDAPGAGVGASGSS